MNKFLSMFILLFPLLINNNGDENLYYVEESQIEIIEILKPNFYSGILPSFYTIIAFTTESVDVFYYSCLITDLEQTDIIKDLDIKKGERYNVRFVKMVINGYIYNNLKVNACGNLILNIEEIRIQGP